MQITGKITSFNHQFSGQDIITIEDIKQYFRLQQPEIKDNAVRVRIHALKEEGIIQSAGKGKYALQIKPIFTPPLSEKLQNLGRIVKENFDLDYCITSSAWINEFSLHQAFHNMIIVEAEKDFLGSLFDVLRSGGKREVYLRPNKEVYELYVSTARNPIIIKSLITRSPIQKKDNFYIPTLEKLLVDLFSDTIVYKAYQGQELIYIFEHAFRLYAVDYNRLLAYAARRKKKNKLLRFLKQKVNNFPKTILNDTSG